MHEPGKESLSNDRLLDAAERLFMMKGFAAVTLRDIGQDLGLTHASLYYHFPGGKEELFVAVTKRNILRHGQALRVAMGSEGDIRDRLYSAAEWFLSQPPIDLIRMAQSDMPALRKESAGMLMGLMYGQVLLPMQDVLQEADETGEIHCANPALVGSALIGMLESFHSMPPTAVRGSTTEMAKEMIDVLLRGLSYRGKTIEETGGSR